MAGVLVIGIGNPLRMDDGVGWRAVEAIAADPRLAGVHTVSTHQLLPELALDVSRAGCVVLVDARVGRPAGDVSVEQLSATSVTGSAWSHHLDPASLAGMARDLYDAAPPLFLIGVGVGSMEHGECLTAAVEAAVPRVVDAVVDIAEGHRTERHEEPVHA
jgi:hydrogenase maturation protease